MNVKQIIKDTSFKFNKGFGQNFIDDDSLLNKIVELSGVCETDTVLEIGVGAGTLTRALSEKAKYVFGYEIDRNLQPVLARSLEGVENAEIIFRDFMKEKMPAVEKMIEGDYIVVANLPYYITSPIVMRLIEEAERCKRIVIMVQKEVAERFCAKEATADYGAITLAIDVKANANIVLNVDKANFFPMPKVDSAVVRIDIEENKYNILSKKAYREVVRVAFSSRRKTLVNNFINLLKLDRLTAEELLKTCDIDILARGETLSTAKFVQLSNLMVDRKILE